MENCRTRYTGKQKIELLRLSLNLSGVVFPKVQPQVPDSLPLCQLQAGQSGRVRALSGEAAFCQRIREMGFGERAFVTKVGGCGPFICVVNGCRLALSHDAAACILVEPSGLRG